MERKSPRPRTRWAPGAAPLADAARVVAAVAFGGRSADDVLADVSGADRAAVRAIALGTIRWYLRLAPTVEALLSRPSGVPQPIRALLVVTAHQIEYSRNAPEASAHAAVDAARILGHPRASGLVNAVLRRFVAERAALLGKVDERLPGRTAHPEWLVRKLEQFWPDRLESILKGNNEHPPMVLRVDLTRGTVAGYLAELEAVGIHARAIPWVPAAVQLAEPVPVNDLPGFREGRVSVQDAGAQLAAPLLGAEEGMRILDACAAPGGKTGHLIEHTPTLGELVAVDVDASRMSRVRENLERLGRADRVTLAVADVRDPASFWDGRPFDRILVDAPCSATGVIRRHPDIKLLRRPQDIGPLAESQLAILKACFGMLATGGRLVYCTCSVLPEENDAVVRALLEEVPNVRIAAAPETALVPPGAAKREPGLQLIPGAEAGSDGFYYACLEKTTAGT
ncbi:MAG TPA: 16S rRNA (cytosine(967)-C(5))-methyltransferase RsmB [Steroidobacteraceae bacterium]